MRSVLRLMLVLAAICTVVLIMESVADDCEATDVELTIEDGIRVTYREKGSLDPGTPEYIIDSNHIMIDDSNEVWAIPTNLQYGRIYVNGVVTEYNGVILDLANYSEGIHFEVFRDDYIISFDSNGGEGNAISSITSLGNTEEYTIPEIGYHYDWCHADVWNTSEDGMGDDINPGDYTIDLDFIRSHYSLSNNDLVLYPKWIENQYSFMFDKNGGTGTLQGTTGYFTISSGSVTIPSVTVSRTGYQTGLWNTSSNGNSTPVDPGTYSINGEFLQTYFGTSNSVTLYPKWDAIHYSFYFNSGEGVTGAAPDNITNRTIGNQFTIQAPTFTKTGYHWAGWNTSADCNGTTIPDGDYTLDEEMIADTISGEQETNLYPIWVPTVYKIRLTTDRSTLSSASWVSENGSFVTEYTIESDDIVLPILEPEDRFHDFICWEDDNERTVSTVSKGSHGDLSYNAVWKEREYTMNVNINGRTVSQKFTIGSILEEPEAEEGFQFVGWFYKDDKVYCL